jgi:hypothetical protein
MGPRSGGRRTRVRQNGAVVRAFALAVLSLCALAAAAQDAAPPQAQPAAPKRFAGFRDPQDGRLDLSDWLLDRKGVLPVPLLITEPALGLGGGVMALFFRESMRESSQKAQDRGRIAPPDIFALGAMGTDNGTRGAALGGMVSSNDGRYRWRGAVVRPDVNLEFFGVGGRDLGRQFNLEGWVSVQHAMVRLGDSDAWLVGRWNFFDLKNRFDPGTAGGLVGTIDRSARSSGLGATLEYDSRDTIFTASRGWKGALDLTFYDPAIGSDQRFQTYRAYAFGYWPLDRSLVLGARADARSSGGTVPFYLLPFVEMRGVPLLRLQDRHTALVETELRWNVDARWALVGFLGAGRAWGTTTSFSEGTDTVTKGGGFRYQLARRLGLSMGVDWAWSTQDHGWYLTVGSAWR